MSLRSFLCARLEAMGAALGCDPDDTLQAALDGTLMESRLVEGYELANGEKGYQGLGRQAGSKVAELLSGAPGPNQNDFVSSTEIEARDGDVIDQSTWRLGHYRRNPVVLEGHRTAVVVGRTTKLIKAPRMLVSRIEWDTHELNQAGRLVAHQHAAGIRRAVSVRWITGKRIARNKLPETDPRYQSRPKKVDGVFGAFERFGNVLFDNTLLEQSSVSVPGDPRALQQRGIGAEAAESLAGSPDGSAARDLRAQMIAALSDDEVWMDDQFRAHFASAMRHAIRTDRDIRRILVAAGLSSRDPRDPQKTNTQITEKDALSVIFGRSTA